MARRQRVWRLGTLPSQRAEAMGETVTGVVGKDRYEREFKEALPKWEMWMEIQLPALDAIKMAPGLTEEQRMWANKEYLRRFREAIRDFQVRLVGKTIEDAKAYVMPIPASPAKPTSLPPGFIV